jgi:hypothetical protein
MQPDCGLPGWYVPVCFIVACPLQWDAIITTGISTFGYYFINGNGRYVNILTSSDYPLHR